MMAKIAVEQSLTAIQEALQAKGYEVVPMKNEKDAQDCDCCVVSGQDENLMGMQDAQMEGPVIDARGMDANQVCEAVEHRFQ